MNRANILTYQNDWKGFLHMLLFMGAGQFLMVWPLWTVNYFPILNMLLFDVVLVDKYLMLMVHLLSGISFIVTILVGIPKALKTFKDMGRKRRIIKRKRKNQQQNENAGSEI